MRPLFTLLAICIIAVSVTDFAVARPQLVLGINAGVSTTPMTSWGDWWTNSWHVFDGGSWRTALEGSIAYTVTPRHHIKVSFEQVTTRAFGLVKWRGGPSVSPYYEWEFTTRPISLSYEHHFPQSVGRFSPFIGAGLGYYRTTIKRTIVGDSYISIADSQTPNSGNGYGFHGYLGAYSRISTLVGFNVKARFRRADGMGFDKASGDTPVDFDSVDVTAGLDLVMRFLD